MININNIALTEFTLPFSSDFNDPIDLEFTHHMSGKNVYIFGVLPTQPTGAHYFTGVIPPGEFKYLGLYTLEVKNLLLETIYTTLANVTEPKQGTPTYNQNAKKNYELYK